MFQRSAAATCDCNCRPDLLSVCRRAFNSAPVLLLFLLLPANDCDATLHVYSTQSTALQRHSKRNETRRETTRRKANRMASARLSLCCSSVRLKASDEPRSSVPLSPVAVIRRDHFEAHSLSSHLRCFSIFSCSPVRSRPVRPDD